MNLKILSFSGKTIEKDNVISVTLTTKSGEITVLDEHTPLITSLTPSTMHFVYKDENNVEIKDYFAVGNGVVEISNSNVKVMLDMLINLEDVDKESSLKAKNNALEMMDKYKNSKDKMDMKRFLEAEDNLLKSIAKLKLYDIKK